MIFLLGDFQSELVVMEPNLSNLLIIGYLLATYIIKEGRFLAVFLLSEVLCNMIWLDRLSEPEFYLLQSTVYCFLYRSIIDTTKTKSLLSIGSAVLFYAWVACDSYIYGEVESFTYRNYIYFEVAVHSCIIWSLIDTRTLKRALGANIDAIRHWFSGNYNTTFIWYNIKNNSIKARK